MHYLIGAITVFILIKALSLKALLAVAGFIIIVALIIQTCASLAMRTKVPFSKSVKATIYSIFFTVLAILLVWMTGGTAIYLLPIIVFIAQAYAISISLNVPFVGSAIIAIIIIAVGWLTMTVFGISLTGTLQIAT
ncbi:MAG: hypothetical protein OCC45_06285 [Desulfotalea sp.]